MMKNNDISVIVIIVLMYISVQLTIKKNDLKIKLIYLLTYFIFFTYIFMYI